MTEKPIIFSGEMVRAIQDGRKTQTRRVVRKQPTTDLPVSTVTVEGRGIGFAEGRVITCYAPYQPGDRLYVRERWRYAGSCWAEHKWPGKRRVGIEYDADGTKEYFLRGKNDDSGIPKQNMPEHLRNVSRDPSTDEGLDLLVEYHAWLEKWWARKRPSIHMPKWAARIWLEVTAVRVERVRDILDEDCEAEGIQQEWTCINPGTGSYAPENDVQDDFRNLWNSLNEKRGHGWDTNPWVWAYTFKVIDNERTD